MKNYFQKGIPHSKRLANGIAFNISTRPQPYITLNLCHHSYKCPGLLDASIMIACCYMLTIFENNMPLTQAISNQIAFSISIAPKRYITHTNVYSVAETLQPLRTTTEILNAHYLQKRHASQARNLQMELHLAYLRRQGGTLPQINIHIVTKRFHSLRSLKQNVRIISAKLDNQRPIFLQA